MKRKHLKAVRAHFAILDVGEGRHKLAAHFEGIPRGVPTPPGHRIPVVIVGFIDAIHSGDDGESREFAVDVQDIVFPRMKG